MILELKPEQQQILEQAMQSGMTQDEVLDRAFAFIQSEQEMGDWLLENRDEVNAQLQESFAQSERGEMIDADEVMRILNEDRAQRQIAS